MEIKIRRIATFKEVQIEDGGIVINLGLFDDKECVKLIKILKDAIYELE